MLERLNPVFRLVCVVLAALVLFQLARLLAPGKRAFGESSAALLAFAGTNAPVAPESSLPPQVSAQIDKIKESQVLGMIMRPPPMAIMGIAGRDVLFRGPTGQTGLLREGEELGGVKILKIGTNRVLIEQDGHQKELMLFQGFGGETLLKNEKEKTK